MQIHQQFRVHRSAVAMGLACLLALGLGGATGEAQTANAAPTISALTDQLIQQGGTTGAKAFTIGDDTTPAGSLTLSGASSSPSLVPAGNIVFGGSGANRTVTVTPAAGQSGVADITVIVTDGNSASATSGFRLTVNAPPTISNIPNQNINEDGTTGNLPFTLGDVETPTAQLTVAATSSNPTLVPSGGIIFGGSGTSRTIRINPAANENGTATITVTVTDGNGGTDSDTFILTVNPVNDAPTTTGALLGTSAAPVSDQQTGITLFQDLTFVDVDQGRPGNETLTVTLIVTAGSEAIGTLRTSGTDSNLPATQTFTGTPASVTTQIRNLVFDPVPNVTTVGQTAIFRITINVVDDEGAAATNNGTEREVYVRSENDLPALSVSLAPSTAPDTGAVTPFRGTVTDSDPGDESAGMTLTVTIQTPGGSAFGALVPEVPSFTGSRATVEAGLQAVVFRPIPNSVSGSQSLVFRVVVTDRNGGMATSDVNFTLTGANDTPTIIGVAANPLRLTDDPSQPPFRPFRSVDIIDPDLNGLQSQTVVLSVGDSSLGTLTPSTLTGTPGQVSTDLKTVQFIPAQRPDRVLGETVSTTLTLQVTDAIGAVRVNSETVLLITSVNGGPVISGLPATPPLLLAPAEVVRPFADLAVMDDDGGQIALTVAIDDPAKGQLVDLGGFLEGPPGTYTRTGTTNEVTLALQGLGFEVSDEYVFPPNAPGGTSFTITAVDGVFNTTVATLEVLLQNAPRNHLVTSDEDALYPADYDEVSQRGLPMHGTLRRAVYEAGNNDVITFDLPTYPALIRLNKDLGPLVLRRNLTLQGPGADLMTVSGDTLGDGIPDVQLMRVEAVVTLEGLTLTQGRATTGGALWVGPRGDLTLRGCAVTDSVATLWGGGIDVDEGALRVENSLFRGNSTDASLGLGGGAVSLFTVRPCSFANTTFSGNRQRAVSGFGGGALYVEIAEPSLDLLVTVTHCTFARNTDASSRATSILANVLNTLVTVRNSVFADGQDRNLGVHGAGRIDSVGGNVSDDSTRIVLTQAGVPKSVILLDQPSDRTQVDPQLGSFNASLSPLGGHVPEAGSPVVGRAVEPLLPVDQRGALRDADPDAGALEFGATLRLALNEIQTSGSPADFLEFYVLRDSAPFDLSGYGVWLNGELRHVFSNSPPTLVRPGAGVVVADTLIAAVGGTPVQTPVGGIDTVLGLDTAGVLEVRTPGTSGRTILRRSYLGVYADPEDPQDNLVLGNKSLTLRPQFRGFAYVPHPLESDSPGGDSGGTPFGSPNAFPSAVDDLITVGEDERILIPVTLNDVDSDGNDRPIIVGLSPLPGDNGSLGSVLSGLGAFLQVLPIQTPTLGTDILYNPRVSESLQSLSEGYERVDTFYYAIVDEGSGSVEELQGATGVSPTTILSANHRLATGQQVLLAGTGNAAYDGVRVVTVVDADRFSIPVGFAGDPGQGGQWTTVLTQLNGTITAYAGTVGSLPVSVTATAHGLVNNQAIVISGASVAAYNGTHVITRVDANTFTLPVAFAGNPTPRGSWTATLSRTPTRRSEGQVTIKVIGANDPPRPTDDVVDAEEETLLRILGDPHLLGSTTVFDTDDAYPQVPQLATVNLLANDDDVDDDDDRTTLRVVGVVSGVKAITAYAGDPGATPVTVTSPGHGLVNNTVILISGYGGHPSYNTFHRVTVVDEDTFTLPVLFVDEGWVTPEPGVWAVLTDENRLQAETERGGEVSLEIRTDRIETSMVYNPLPSSYLDALPKDAIGLDSFYYAVEDSHGAVSLAKVTLRVTGRNDDPIPVADPPALARLPSGTSLGVVISNLVTQFQLPSGTLGRSDVEVQYLGTAYALDGLWSTDEETPITLLTEELTSNDFDVDTGDIAQLKVVSVSSPSLFEAAVTLSADGASILYDPSVSDVLDALARGEPVVDGFEVVISDEQGGLVSTWVAVVVTGLNDTPEALDDAASTPEDTELVVLPLANDIEEDINGVVPDNQLRMIPQPTTLTPLGAELTVTTEELVYDPTVSAYLNSLQQDATVVEIIPYTAADGSLVFANTDYFRVQADGSGYDLDVLANDRNLTGSGGSLSLLEVGTPNRGGSALVAAGNRVTYSPQVNYVGDEVFPYTVTDANGNVDRGIVVVRVEVNALNGNLQAADDAYHVAKGQSPLLAVLANDNILPAPGGSLSITRIVTSPLRDRVEITPTGITYIQEDAGPFPYDTTFQYEVSGGGVSRAVATVRVTVVDREGTLDARADAFSLPSDTTLVPLDVLANDNILPGTPVVLGIAQVAREPEYGTVVIEAGGGRLLYTPNQGFVGRDTLRYLATDRFGGTGFAEVTLMVGTLYTANDIFTVAFDDPNTTEDDHEVTVLDVLANDRVLQTDPQTLTIDPTSLPTTSLGTLTLGTQGRTLIFNPHPGQVGEEDLLYTIRDGSTPARTAQGRLTLVVIESGVRANPDFYAVEVGSGGNVLPVLSNDAAIPDRGRRLAIVSIGSGLDAPNRGGTVSIADSGDAFLYTPAPGFSGEEVFTYVMTDSRSFDTAKVVVRVTSGALVASEDAFTVFFGTEPDPENAGQVRPVTFSLPLLANDRVIPDLGQLLQITGVGIDDINAENAPDRAGWAEVSADGTTLLYTPRQDTGFPYIEQFTYEISDGTARRTQARVAITVQERTGFRDMQTENDAYAVLRDSAGNVLPVLANDDVKPSGAAGWTITETTPAAFGGVVSISGRNLLYTPRPNFVGTDTFTYFVSDGVGGTGSALVRVKVGDLSLSPDVFTALSGSADNELDVLANDGLRPEEGLGYQLVGVTVPQYGAASVLNARVLYTPSAGWSGGYPYADTFEYIVEDDSGLEVRAAVQVTVYEEGSDRDDANVTITVVGVNDAPTITGTRSGLEVYHRGTIRPFATVTLNDPDEVPNPDPLTLRIVISHPTRGYLTGASGVALPNTNGEYLFFGTDDQLTALIRTLVFVPTTGDPSRVAPGVSEETRLTIYLSDPYVTVVDANTTVIARHAEVTRLTASDGSSADEFGFSVGASRKLVVAGAPFDDDAMIQGSGNKTGSAYLYARDAGGANAWGEASKIVALQRGIGDEFGYASDVNEAGNLVVVGARKARPSGVTTGAAWVFRRSGEGWVEEARLVAPGLASGDEYGYSVALNGAGTVLVVGSPKHRPPSANRTGAAFVFTRNAANQTWTFVTRLNPTDGSTDDEFGRSVSVNGTVIVVGSPRHSPTSKKSGAMYAYRQQASGSWALASKLRPAAGDNGDEFGHSVAVFGDWLAAGARLDEANGKKSGTVYLFQQSTTNPNQWTERRMLQSPQSGIDDEYGFSVDLDGQFLAVGARRESIAGRRAGALYVHARDQGGTAQWGLVERLIPDSVDRDDEFGYSVALRQGVVAVGARRQQLDGRRFGATYVYQLRYNNAPLAVGQIDRLIANVEEPFEYFLPQGLFADTDIGDSLVGRQLTLADGSDIPGWLAFDDVQGRLYADTPPTTFDVGVLDLRLTAFDEDGSGANLDFELEVVVPPGFVPSLVNAPSPALAWSLAHAGGTPMPAASASMDFLAAWVDPDGDGRSNLEEYAQGTDPFVADALDARAGIVVHLTSDGALELQFQRRGDDPRMVCVVEGSADLLHWQALSGGLEKHRQPVSSAMETVRVVYAGQGSGEFQFFRVRMDYR